MVDIDIAILGRNVKRLRKKQKLTLEQLAENIGSSKSYVWSVENGKALNPSVTHVARIAIELNTTIDYLMFAEDYEGAPTSNKAFTENLAKLDAKETKRLHNLVQLWVNHPGVF